MSRIRTFAAIGVILLVTLYAQQLLIDVIGPTSNLYQMVEGVTWPVNGEEWAAEMYEAITVWFMWVIRVGVIVIGLYNEFVRQNVTTQRAAAGGPP
ncbi:hypothetical protein Hbl1158_16980 (plasmid) [Halobaculum sp. CBA1158]|uniref:hypothetical protein n=1 Tax=Halobaculum sp. CBA1158 TaxID=2904243 RepID=UPI001F3731FE|nr:hypothetical protein [Halobaculum sp. CBA1158]UIP01697.1 hypothetical protein Hbl1158_16980 [Halobaculum sp. CBA1158]